MKRYSIFGAIGITVGLVLFIFYNNREIPEEIVDGIRQLKSKISFRQEPAKEYGIEVEDFYICTEKIRPNQNLSEILSAYDIPMQVIHELAEKSSEVFDVRKIKTGSSYCIMRSTDSLSNVNYFVYEQDPVNYVVYEMGDSVSIYKGKKTVETRRAEASGIIYSSLWRTLTENDLDPNLALRLSDVFAWSIDFYRIQKGDNFKIIYDEEYVDGEKVGVGTIAAAYFNHGSRDFWAFEFEQDSVLNYFDENAHSLRKAFLKAPLEFRRISSGFTNRRFHPILKRNTAHLGTDYAAATGTPIWAVGDGTVVEARYHGGKGNFVKIRHNGTYTTQYLHMSKFGSGIKQGVAVKQGDVIGYVGSTGLSTGPHLHYEMIKNGSHVDATREEMPPGDPIKDALKPAFSAHKAKMMAQLKGISLPETEAKQGEDATAPEKAKHASL